MTVAHAPAVVFRDASPVMGSIGGQAVRGPASLVVCVSRDAALFVDVGVFGTRVLLACPDEYEITLSRTRLTMRASGRIAVVFGRAARPVSARLGAAGWVVDPARP